MTSWPTRPSASASDASSPRLRPSAACSGRTCSSSPAPDDGLRAGDKTYKVVLLDRDSQSDPARAGQLAKALINDDKGRPPIKAVLNAVKQIAKHRGSDSGPDQPIGFKDLDSRLSQALTFSIEQAIIGSAEAIGLQRALQQLPEEKREILLLCRFQELKYEEIAGLLGCELNTVRTRIHRALQDLRKAFHRLAQGAMQTKAEAAAAENIPPRGGLDGM